MNELINQIYTAQVCCKWYEVQCSWDEAVFTFNLSVGSVSNISLNVLASLIKQQSNEFQASPAYQITTDNINRQS